MPLIYPESLVKIFKLKVGEIAVSRLLRLSVYGRMDGWMDAWTTETLSQPIKVWVAYRVREAILTAIAFSLQSKNFDRDQNTFHCSENTFHFSHNCLNCSKISIAVQMVLNVIKS